jgi:hypothetical protein
MPFQRMHPPTSKLSWQAIEKYIWTLSETLEINWEPLLAKWTQVHVQSSGPGGTAKRSNSLLNGLAGSKFFDHQHAFTYDISLEHFLS